jgi:hypothetical protein
MIETKDITKMVQHIVRRNRGVADPQIMHPMREWVIGISVTLVGVFIGAVFAASLYSFYDAKNDSIITVTETVVPYNAVVVEEALTDYRLKKSAYEAVGGIFPTEVIATTTENSSDTNASTTPEVLIIDTATPEEVVDTTETAEVEPTETVVSPDLAI